jgi:DNA-binding transcriptional MerR regulator
MNQLTIGAVADHFGVAPWQVRRLFERGMLPPAARVGAYRVVDPSDLPKIEGALREAGYWPQLDTDGGGVAR